MKASVVDLRYKMRNILKALDRNEQVTILYHGQEKAIITPVTYQKKQKVSSHPFFGMKSDSDDETVNMTMEKLRGGRH